MKKMIIPCLVLVALVLLAGCATARSTDSSTTPAATDTPAATK